MHSWYMQITFHLAGEALKALKVGYTLLENQEKRSSDFPRCFTASQNRGKKIMYKNSSTTKVFLFIVSDHAQSFVSAFSHPNSLRKWYTLNENLSFGSRMRTILEFVLSEIFVRKVRGGCQKLCAHYQKIIRLFFGRKCSPDFVFEP